MKILCPKETCCSLFDLNVDRLWDKGIRGLMLDIDNTIARHHIETVTPEQKDWVHKAKERGFRICLVSNALPQRVQAFSHQFDIPGVPNALKPLPRAFLKGLRYLSLPANEVAMVGDQLFTDVFGANRLGLYTVLVDPFAKKEPLHTRLIRSLEFWVLYRQAHKGLLTKEEVQRREVGRK